MKTIASFFSAFRKDDAVARNIFWILAALAGIFMVWISKDYGITWDEWEASTYGSYLVRYFLSGFKDLTFFNWEAFHPYGKPVYMAAFILKGLFSGSIADFVQNGLRTDALILGFYETAHRLNAFTGFLAILFTGLLAKELGNWRTALLASLFLFFSPRFLGSAMNNYKDIPFAAMYAASFYCMLLWIKALPAPSKKLSAALIFFIAAAIWTRAGAFILIFYLFLFVGLHTFLKYRSSRAPAPWLKVIGLTLVIAFFSYLGGLLLWPYAQLDPIQNPLKALLKFSNYTYWDHEVFFNGQMTQASKLPWYYVPQWILISTPLFFLSGLCFLMLFTRQIFEKGRRFAVFMVAFGALFPLLYVMARRSVLYDGWRHLFFIYPLAIVLITLAWQKAWGWASRSRTLGVFTVLFLIQIAEPALWMIKNHPNEYVYFNALTGGLKGAFLRYETDYWGNSLRKGAEWLANYQVREGLAGPIQVRADSTVMSSYPFLKKELGALYAPFGYPADFLQKEQCFFLIYPPLYMTGIAYLQPWDYALALSKNWPAGELKTKWPPLGTIHEVKADGVTLCAVVKNPLKK
jgi:hypothetical protein